MRDFSIQLSHRPGELSRVCDALALRGVNIKSLAGMTVEGQACIRMIFDDVDAARAALEDAGVPYEEHEVVQVLLENAAGELSVMTTRLAEAGVNLEAIYLTGFEAGLVELAVVADNVKQAKKILEF